MELENYVRNILEETVFDLLKNVLLTAAFSLFGSQLNSHTFVSCYQSVLEHHMVKKSWPDIACVGACLRVTLSYVEEMLRLIKVFLSM